MNKDFDPKKLDITTLEFAIETAWQYEFLCKDTVKGRTQAEAFKRVQSTLEHYKKEIEEGCKNW